MRLPALCVFRVVTASPPCSLTALWYTVVLHSLSSMLSYCTLVHCGSAQPLLHVLLLHSGTLWFCTASPPCSLTALWYTVVLHSLSSMLSYCTLVPCGSAQPLLHVLLLHSGTLWFCTASPPCSLTALWYTVVLHSLSSMLSYCTLVHCGTAGVASDRTSQNHRLQLSTEREELDIWGEIHGVLVIAYDLHSMYGPSSPPLAL